MSHGHDAVRASHAGQSRSAGLAFVLGLLLGGVAFFYVLPPRRAMILAALAYGAVLASGLILWVPVFLLVAFLAAREARLSEGRLAFDGGPETTHTLADNMHVSRQTPPLSYVRIRSR